MKKEQLLIVLRMIGINFCIEVVGGIVMTLGAYVLTDFVFGGDTSYET